MNQYDMQIEIHRFVFENYIFDSHRNLDDHASLLGSGVIDSTGILELIAHIEQRFNISCEDDELVRDNFDSVDKITTFVCRKLSAQQHDNANAA